MADGWSSCSLDPGGCLNLNQILHSFSAPISEEHAWAVIHQSLVCLSQLLERLAQNELLFLVSSTSQILLGSDGNVHADTFTKQKGREKAGSEKKTIAELGMVIFNALDFGLKLDEERQLSPALENIIDIMTSLDCENEDGVVKPGAAPAGGRGGPDSDSDEGIENDELEEDEEGENGTEHLSVQRSGACTNIIQLCRNHLALPTEADSHFRAVCRALVSEALELSFFMEKVSRSKGENLTDNELNELKLQDWARLWVQVIHELRTGIKLKKTEYTKTPIEYELTPYEILMDDIRSRRYKLNKVMVDGRLPPQMKKDAHDIILDFIRSRPPLKPVGERQLCPGPRKQSTPVELLMESIRSESSRTMLRKTPGPKLRPLVISSVESSRCKLEDWEPSPLPNRRVIKPDQDLMESLLNFSDDEDESDDGETKPDEPEDQNTWNKKPWHTKLALDLILHGPALTGHHQRRHSVSVCQTPIRAFPPSQQQQQPAPSTTRQLPPRQQSLDTRRLAKLSLAAEEKRSQRQRISVDLEELDQLEEQLGGQGDSTGSQLTSKSSSMSDIWTEGLPQEEEEGEQGGTTSSFRINTPQMHAKLHSEFIHSEQWAAALQTLELSMEEVVHIRSVLTRAELEALPLDNNLKEDVARGKLCFLCMRTRFSLFSWGTRCQLCSQQVCSKCSRKMHIPLEHFSSVPVFALSPTAAAVTPPGGPSHQDQLPAPAAPHAVTFKERLASLTPEFPAFWSGGGGGVEGAGSAPTSPLCRRKDGVMVARGTSAASRGGAAGMPSEVTGSRRSLNGGPQGGPPGPLSLPVFTSQGPSTITTKFGNLKRALSRDDGRSRRESIEGTLLTVCHDCREMVLQVVRSQKTARRIQLQRSLYLNLSPGYKKEIY